MPTINIADLMPAFPDARRGDYVACWQFASHPGALTLAVARTPDAAFAGGRAAAAGNRWCRDGRIVLARAVDA